MSSTPADILRRHHLKPKKEWGQNFLGDDNILESIAEACSLTKEDAVVELGAGLGHLTRHLAATGAQVTAVERDRELVAVLELELKLPNVKVLAANAAELDFAKVAGVPKAVVCGNLPYHLSSTILFEVLDQRATVSRAVFLLQKEVAERIAAGPGGRDYGLLSVLLQAYAEVELLFVVHPGSFLPPPKVDSAVVRIDVLPKPRADVKDHARFVKLVKAAFSMRRKILLNGLKSDKTLGDAATLQQALATAGIDPLRRAETLSAAEFAAIERALP